LYLGGWHVPFLGTFGFSDLTVSLIQVGAFCVKVLLMILFFIIIRWTVPRFRYDQLMNLGWKIMLPLAVLNLLLTGIGILWLENLK
jgi:NADH-quinone oxidoreductase subunit H